MIEYIKKKIQNLFFPAEITEILKLQIQLIEEQKIITGQLLTNSILQNEAEVIGNIHKAEFKVFSQWGDDGIIQFLANYLSIGNKIFVEFGVENYRESNTRFLLNNNNWKGLVIDGNLNNINQIKNSNYYWKFDLNATHAFITKDNINHIIKNAGISGEIGLLHIDIDGNDYWIWESIHEINPTIVIVEYNSVFGSEKAWTIPYQEDFIRSKVHYSNLYFGCSLVSLCELAHKKGYIFIGSNSHGNNAYFIKKEKAKNLIPKTAADGFINSKFREARDRNGKLLFIENDQRLELIKGMKVYDIQKNSLETI